MITEIFAVLGTVAVFFLFFKERDLRYALFFLMGFLGAVFVEAPGISSGQWSYQFIAYPLSYLFFSTPLAMCMLYGALAASMVFIFKVLTRFEKKHTYFDYIAGFVLAVTGLVLLILGILIHLNMYLGLVLMMSGILLVSAPIVIYLGLIMMFADILIEFLIVSAAQLNYVPPHDFITVAVYFFFITVIVAAMIQSLDERLALTKEGKNRLSFLLKQKRIKTGKHIKD
jgi:hypothetical protein